jgi:hypothetical protein
MNKFLDNISKISIFMFIILFVFSCATPIKETKSGKAEGIFVNQNIEEVTALLLEKGCVDNGLAIETQTKNNLICKGEMGLIRGALFQSAMTGSYGSTPELHVQFNIFENDNDVRVIMSEYVTSKNFFGKLEREDLDVVESRNRHQEFLFSLGAE